MHRLFAETLSLGDIVLDAATTKHARILRLMAGDTVELFDGQGHAAEATLLHTSDDPQHGTVGTITRVFDIDPEPSITLVLALPKGNKLNTMVRMATELGATQICLALSEHAIPQSLSNTKRQRLERIAREATRQCNRGQTPTIHAPEPLLAIAAKAAKDTTKWMAWVRADPHTHQQTHQHQHQQTSSLPLLPPPLWLVIGPEGGISMREATALQQLGYQPISLGNAILRVDTAVAAALARAGQYLGVGV